MSATFLTFDLIYLFGVLVLLCSLTKLLFSKSAEEIFLQGLLT